MAEHSPAPTVESLEDKVRRLEEQVHELQTREKQRPRALVERLVPLEVRRHLRAAQRERLLAVRALIDAAIEKTQDAPARSRRPESVHID